MPRSIKFYYGMCGTFKATTIKASNDGVNTKVVWSDIKPWKKFEKSLELEQNDLIYANLHLYNLEKEINGSISENIFVERGVTDMFFYYVKNNPVIKDACLFLNRLDKAVELEEEICKDFEITRILLIQEDVNFVKDVIFKEPTRLKEFPGGVDEFLREQDKYVRFTTTHNSIGSTINIKSAKEYIESLGLKFNQLN